ncbi:MAG: response regulator [Ignavibacteriaceae bacterium]|nr:response regulator [Ignavibacteriaceae bacterium]MCW9095436.1 response regulator [Ignavibacteriaceae bacterium]
MAGVRSKLLVVEDNRETQLIIKVTLRDKYDLQVVGNATDAISLLLKNNFDLVLLDLNLDGQDDGKNILTEIREEMRNFDLPVIIATAYDLKPEDEEFYNQNANGFIPKPFDKKTLLESVNKVLLKN